jgi:formiminotetrahydrofolate cyclodeaminase
MRNLLGLTGNRKSDGETRQGGYNQTFSGFTGNKALMPQEQSLQTFLNELASKSPTPGGGGAAAVMGATAAALISMVCNLTIGKKNYESVEGDMRAVLEKAERLRGELTAMILADIDVFNTVMGAYGMPKETDEQKALRGKCIQEALQQAADVPLACARLCMEVISLSREAAEKGNRNVVSDAGVAVIAAYAALKSAALNVYVNAGSIQDQEFARTRLAEVERLQEDAERQTQDIYQRVMRRIAGE